VLRLVEEMEVSGRRKVGRPRKTWKDIVKRDLELLGVDESVALEKGRWRKIITSPTPTSRENMDFLNENVDDDDDDIFNVCSSSYFHIRALRHIRTFPDSETSKTIARTTVPKISVKVHCTDSQSRTKAHRHQKKV